MSQTRLIIRSKMKDLLFPHPMKRRLARYVVSSFASLCVASLFLFIFENISLCFASLRRKSSGVRPLLQSCRRKRDATNMAGLKKQCFDPFLTWYDRSSLTSWFLAGVQNFKLHNFEPRGSNYTLFWILLLHIRNKRHSSAFLSLNTMAVWKL